MRSAILCALVVISLALNVAATDYTIRGELSSLNVLTRPDGVSQGKFNIDGRGEVAVTYYSDSDTLGFYSSHNFYDGFGPFTNLVFNYGSQTKVLAATVSHSESGSVSFDWGSDKKAAQSAENAFIAALVAGDYWVQFDAEQYPNGIARANLDNLEKFGTSALKFTSALTSDTSASTGALVVTFDRDTAELTFTFTFNFQEKDSNGKQANPTQISSISISNPYDDVEAYTFNPSSSDGTKKITETVQTNYRYYTTLRSGNVVVSVSTSGGNAPSLSGVISPVVVN
jgi:hypothetical protein